jgi:4-hydroxybenzoyl-CoA reductase subunit beta
MMRLPRFEFHSPRSVDEAIALMQAAGHDGAYVAGGTDLYPNMKRRQQTPAHVINLMGIAELQTVAQDAAGRWHLGSGVLLNTLVRHAALAAEQGALVAAVSQISTPLLRNMGTLGGNVMLDTRCNYYDQNYEWRQAINFCMKKDGAICWVAPSSPRCWAVQSSDSVPVLVAQGADVVLRGPQGTRSIPVEQLFVDDGIVYHTKAADEVLVEIVMPVVGTSRSAFRKLRRRGAFDFAALSVAARVDRSDDGVVTAARIVLGAVGSWPLRATEAESLLVGQKLTPELCAAAGEAAYRPAKPMDNTDFAYAWRKQMVRKWVRDTLADLTVP